MEERTKKGGLQRLAAFDINDRLGISDKLLGRWKWLTDRKRLWWVLTVIVGLTILGVILAITGVLGDLYRAIFERFPGRQWTYVMRDHEWLFGILAVALIGTPFILFKPKSWKAAALTYIVFWTGFLGGHVFWGSSGPGDSYCFNSAFEARVDPHNRLVVAQADGRGGEAIVFTVKVTARDGQTRDKFTVDVMELVTALEAKNPSGLDVQQMWTEDDPFTRTVVISPLGNTVLADGVFEGQVFVEDTSNEDLDCELHEPYMIEVGS